MDPMDADIVMSPEYDAVDVDCNVEACYPCWPWLSRLGRSRRNANGGRADVEGPLPRKEKPSRLLWTGMNSMTRSCVHGVEITCKSIIMANCVAGVGPFLP